VTSLSKDADLRRSAAAYLGLAVLLFVASGSSCPVMRQPTSPTPPIAFSAAPTLQETMQVVNANTQRVQRLQTDSASLALQGVPVLRASLALQRPRSFRLRAQFIGMGQVLDLGSNDERFWAWVDAPQLVSNVPRGVYFARHDQFRQSQARALIPVQPDWLIESFGLVEFDPAGTHEGPYARGPDRMELRSRIPSPEGPVTRVTVLHARYAWLLEQHFYNPQGQLIASALASNHRYYPEAGVSLPHRISIQLPPPANSFLLEIQNYAINQLYSDPAQLFTMPAPNGYPVMDLGAAPGPGLNPMTGPPGAGGAPLLPPLGPGYAPGYPAAAPGATGPGAAPAASATSVPVYPTADLRPRYRGYTATR
jgi:hypothetical protein